MSFNFKTLLSFCLYLLFVSPVFSQNYWNPGTTVKFLEYKSSGDGPNFKVEARYQPTEHKIKFTLGQAWLNGYKYEGKVYTQIKGIKNHSELKNYSGQDYLPMEMEQDFSVDLEVTLDYRGQVKTVNAFICSSCPSATCTCDIHTGATYFGMSWPPDDDKEYYKHVRVMDIKLKKVYFDTGSIPRLIRNMLEEEQKQEQYSNYIQEGDRLMQQGDFEKAETAYKEAKSTGINDKEVEEKLANTNQEIEAKKEREAQEKAKQEEAKQEEIASNTSTPSENSYNSNTSPSNTNNSTSSQSYSNTSQQNSNSSEFTPEEQAWIETQEKSFEQEKARRQAEINRRIAEQKAEMQRWEVARGRTLNNIQSFVNRIPQISTATPRIYNAATIQQAFVNMQGITNTLKQQQEQNLQNFAGYMARVNPSNAEEAKADLVGALAVAGATAVKNAEIKKEMKKAQEAFEYKCREARDKLLNTYSKNYNQVKGQDAYEPDPDMENYYRTTANYWACAYNELNDRFNYNNVSWANIPYSCKEPSMPSSVKKRFSAAEYLKIAQRKKEYYKKSEDAKYLEASKYFLNKSIKMDSKSAEAQAFKAELLPSVVDQYAQALYAHQLDRNNKYAKNILAQKEKLFTEELFSAIYAGNTSFLKNAIATELYKGKTRINPATSEKESPLVASINADKVESFDLFYREYLSEGKDMKKTALLLASKSDKANIASHLVNNIKMNPDTELDGLLALDVAFTNESSEVFSALIKAGAGFEPLILKYRKKPKLKKEFVDMLVYAAYSKNDVKLLERAIKEAKLSPTDASLYLLQSITEGKNEFAESLIRNLNPPENFFSEQEYSYAHAAIAKDNPEGLKLLIDNGYSLNLKDAKGRNPLQYLFIVYPEKIMDTDYWHHFDLNEPDESGAPPLHRAIFGKNPDLMVSKILSTGKVDVNQKGYQGWTALHYAARENNSALVNTLLEFGADKTIKVDKGRTPYHIAKRRKHNDIKKVLK